MTGNVLFELCHSRADGIRRATEFWKVEREQAPEELKKRSQEVEFVWEIEAVVQECLPMVKCLRNITNSAFKKMAANEVRDYQCARIPASVPIISSISPLTHDG